MTNDPTPGATPRSARLSATTDASHQRLHDRVAAARPFDDRARFGRFATVQYRFQCELDPLYHRRSLQAWLPGLAERSRLRHIAADLHDLGLPLPGAAIDADVAARGTESIDDDAALGWLFVSEGSTLGAAMLLKRVEPLGLSADFGARYLAPAPEGRGRHWNTFVDAFDRLELPPARDAAVSVGANAAFQRFASLMQCEFTL